MKRTDDYEQRREHLKGLTDEQLKERFWQLAEQLTDPLLKMGYEYTSPAVERLSLIHISEPTRPY